MKEENKLRLAVMIPVVLGIALIIAGMISSNSTVLYVGIATLFGGSFLVAIITVIVFVVKAMRDTGDDKTSSTKRDEKDATQSSDDRNDAAEQTAEREKEYERIHNVNSTYGVENQIAQAEHQISHISKAYKGSSRSEKAKGCTFAFFFVGSFIGCAVGGMVLLSMDYILPGILVFACAFLIIIGSLVVVKIKEHLSMSTKYKPEDYTRKVGRVKLCVMSSETSTGARSTHISSVTYRVELEIEGKTYNAYSRNYYAKDELLPVLVHKKGKTVKIFDLDFIQANNIDDDDFVDDDDYVGGGFYVSDEERKALVDSEFDRVLRERAARRGGAASEKPTAPKKSKTPSSAADLDKKNFNEIDDMMSEAEDELFAAMEMLDDETYDMLFESWSADIDKYGDGSTPKEVFTGHYKTAVKYRALVDEFIARSNDSENIHITPQKMNEFLASYVEPTEAAAGDDTEPSEPFAAQAKPKNASAAPKTTAKRASTGKKTAESKTKKTIESEQAYVAPEKPPVEIRGKNADERSVEPVTEKIEQTATERAEPSATDVATQKSPEAPKDGDRPTLGYKGIKRKK